MLTAVDFHGLYAIIPTPSTAGADRADALDTVDLEETARVVEQLIADRIDGLIVLGTTGECATITRDEYEGFVECVLATGPQAHPDLHRHDGVGHARSRRAHPLCARPRRGRDSAGLADVAAADRRYGGRILSQHRRAFFPGLAIMVYGNSARLPLRVRTRILGPRRRRCPGRSPRRSIRVRRRLLESQAAAKGRGALPAQRTAA